MSGKTTLERDRRGRGVFALVCLTYSLLSLWLLPSESWAAPADLDPTFAGDGVQTTNFGAGPSSASDVVRQADGKLVTVGRSFSGDFALTRHTADGALDSTFSGDGLQTTDFGGDESATAAAVQADGGIVVAGVSEGDFALARYGIDGTLDPSFSGDGKLTTDITGFDFAADIALQQNGNSPMNPKKRNQANQGITSASYSKTGAPS